MPRFEEYTEKTGLEEDDVGVVYDREGKATKKFSLGNLFKWITTGKISALETKNKNVVESINEINEQAKANAARLDALPTISTGSSETWTRKNQNIGKAALHYYDFHTWGNNDDESAAVLAQYEVIVAGGALYNDSPMNENKRRQVKIIERAKKKNPDLKIFFYISIASWRNDGGWSHILGKGGYWDEEEAAKHSGAVKIHTKWELFQMLEYAAHIGGTKSGQREFIESYSWTDDNGVKHTEDKYIDLYDGGIAFDGCFYDDAGMESDEGRVNQGFPAALREKYIQLVDFTHSRNLAAFPNQLSEDWYSDKVSKANPNGLRSSIDGRDYMLVESCHTQVGFQGKPLWRHVNGTEGVWNYYQNWYSKVGTKVVVNDYLYGTGGDSPLSDEEKYQLATYILCDSLCCGAQYIDLNGLLVWDYAEKLKELLIPNDEEYHVERKAIGHYILHANGHTLEVKRGENLSSGETVNSRTLGKVYIYFDGVRIKNMFADLPSYALETNGRLDSLEKDVTTIKTSYKSTANIYHRMMIDDWGKKLIYTNYVKSKFIKELQEKAKQGIITINETDEEVNRIKITRITDDQMNIYIEVDIQEKKGHTMEFGFSVLENSGTYNWGFNAEQPAEIGWSWISTALNSVQTSSFYGDNFNGYIRTITIPEDAEEDTWRIRICYNGAKGEVFDLSNFYVIDLDEYGEDITKEWYTNLIPNGWKNNNNLEICYTVEKIDAYNFDITWNKPENYADWSGLLWIFPEGTFIAGHTYELGFDLCENNAGSENISFRLYYEGNERWIPKSNNIKSTIYKDNRCGLVFTVSETATDSSGSMTLTNTSGKYKNSEGEYYKESIRGMYLYDTNEDKIVVRGEEPSNSFLQICRVTDEKLKKDKKLIGNALYITDSGKMFITDFNGNRTDIVK